MRPSWGKDFDVYLDCNVRATQRLLEKIRDELADVAVVEHMPKLEGRQMIMVLAPKKK